MPLKQAYNRGKKMNSTTIRKKFIAFFKKHGHTIVPSSPLIPAQDPTLLFANAGMNQFKDTFLGQEKRSYTTATSIQKCVRAGGKHNDLDEVGFTARHLTFFEMMGNFSFGDYFKKEAIIYAWDFLTKEMGFDQKDLYPTVFKDDKESFDIWHTEIGIPQEKIGKLGKKDNFWQMGDTGPCGPCSEIYADQGKKYGCGDKACAPGCECDRYIEIWNLVFMQYDQQADGTLIPLKQKGVDTGMGFERLCMFSQGKNSVFETDLFEKLYKKIEKITDRSYEKSSKALKGAFHVLSDHVRSSCLIMADGGTPSNEGRGYVLRKIIRRAALFAGKLSKDDSLFVELAKEFIKDFSSIYPELKENKELIIKLVNSEVKKFSTSLKQGQVILSGYIKDIKAKGKKKLSGSQAFKLYDTYGFPLELTNVITRQHDLDVDADGFEKEMKKQQEQSGKKTIATQDLPTVPEHLETEFVGYETFETKTPLTFVELSRHHAWIIAARSPFYVESGGQVDDQGHVIVRDHSYPVIGLAKINNAIAVKIDTSGASEKNKKGLVVGQEATSMLDSDVRMDTVRNHTATHLLQAALTEVVGKGIKQAGSLVNDQYLRFDVTYPEAFSDQQLHDVEMLVNKKIQENITTHVWNTTLKKAKEAGVVSFFGEKYNPDNVRVVEIPGFSSELCGGAHAPSTGIIGCFKITSEAALSSGVRRIVAVTGNKALHLFQQSFATVRAVCEMYKVQPHDALDAIQKNNAKLLTLTKEVKRFKKQAWKTNIPQWQKNVEKVENIPFLYLEVDDLGNDELKQICKEVEKKSPGLYLLISRSSDDTTKVRFMGYVSDKYKKAVDLKGLAAVLRQEHDLRGGGSAELIQGGGTLKSSIEKDIKKWITSQHKNR